MGIRIYLLIARVRALEWSLRTCFCAAIAIFLCLYRPSQEFIAYHGTHEAGLPFSMFIAIVVKDSTLGATILNGWVSLIGVFVSSFFCWWTTLSLESAFRYEYGISIMFLLAFAIQYVEFHLLGKKIALSILALTFLTNHIDDPLEVWRFCGDVLFGVGCASIGNLLPWPKLASKEVENLSHFLAKNISTLFDSLINDFLNLSNNIGYVKNEINNSHRKKKNEKFPLNSPENLEAGIPVDEINNDNDTDIEISKSVRRASILIEQKNMEKSTNKRYMRHELILRLGKTLLDFQARSLESRFEASRYRAIHRYAGFANLCRKLLLIMEALEQRIEHMTIGEQSSLQRLLAIPVFQDSILILSQRFKEALMELSWWLSEKSNSPRTTAITSIAALDTALKDLDRVYGDCRKAIYYNLEDDSTFHTIDPEFFLNSNTLMFLLDSACKLVQECEPKMHHLPKTTEIAPSKWTLILQFFEQLKMLSPDLIPSQRQLFSCVCSTGGGLVLPPAVAMRLRQASSVSVSMVLAGLYSYISGASDLTFAAFTVSYIAGGAMAGASIITSFNRAVGTVVACVFCLIVNKIIFGWSNLNSKLFVGIIVILTQFPSTYIRSIPKYGYAGTVFGFTVPILLVSFRTFSNDIVLQRIVDTVVAVIIFVLVELLFLGRHYSEDLLLDDTLKIVKGIESHFKDFTDIFKAYKDDDHTKDNSAKNQQLFLMKDLRAPTFLTDIRRQRELTKLMALELSIWRPKPFREHLMQELLSNEEKAHKCIELMSWAVRACHIHNANLASEKSIRNDSDNMKNDNIAVTSFSFLLLPLEQDVINVESLICRACVQLSEGLLQLKNVTLPSKRIDYRRATQDILNSVYPPSNTSIYDFLDVSTITSRIPEEESELFEHFVEISKQLQHTYRETHRTLQLSQSMTSNNNDASNEKCDLENDLTSTNNKSIKNSNIQSVVVISSNAEVKIVNTALVCLRDLLDSMSALARTIARMQAYRAVQLTESKYINF